MIFPEIRVEQGQYNIYFNSWACKASVWQDACKFKVRLHTKILYQSMGDMFRGLVTWVLYSE